MSSLHVLSDQSLNGDGSLGGSCAHPEAQLRQPLLPSDSALQEKDDFAAAPLPSNLP